MYFRRDTMACGGASEYQGIEVCHVLYLPLDWKFGDKYSVIVEYTGNNSAVFLP